MTRIDKILAETARREIEGLTAARAVERLLELGVLSRHGYHALASRIFPPLPALSRLRSPPCLLIPPTLCT